MTEEFQQPTLDDNPNPKPAPERPVAQRTGFGSKAIALSGDNTGKKDALSVALANQRRVVAPAAAKPEPPGIYCLDYVYNGEHIHETHRSIESALSRVAALKRIGIVPATSVADDVAAEDAV